MAFTGRLGTDDSQLGNIVLGSDGSGGTTTVNGSITADAVLLATASVTFTGNSVLLVTVSAIFAADAYIITITATTGNFTADADILATVGASFTANSALLGTIVATFTADSVISAGASTVSGSFTASAVLKATISATYTANSALLRTVAATFTANARLLRVISTTFTANAVIAFATFTANAVILKTVTTSRTANAVIKKPDNLRTFTADAYFGSTPVPPVLIFEDTFTRTTSAGNIGTPSGGHQEVVTYSWPDSSPEYYVDGSKLVVPVSDGFPEVQFNLGVAAEEFDVYFDIVTVVNGYYQFWGPQRYNPAGTPPFNYTRQYITIDNDAGDGTSWEIFVPSFDGVNSPFETLTLTANTTYRVHAQVIGSTVKARIFDPALAEPSTWDVQGIGAIASTDSVDQNTAGIYIGWVDTIVAPLSLDNLQIYARGIQRQDFFTADAYIGVGGPTEHTGTFTADAYLSQPFIRYGYSFSANAVIKGITSKTITANARIILSGSGTFTANAYIRGVAEKVFTASAVIRRPAAAPGESRFSKITTLQVQRRRDRALSTFVPPRNPDEGEDEETEKELPCLPPCPPGSGGLGGLYGPNGLAIRKTIFYCASCGGNFFHTPENDLGVGPGASTTHGCCTSSHSDVNHVSRMWVQYATVPAGVFQMRAKALWVGDLPNTTVQVYANAVMPDLELEDCMGYDPDWWLSHWQAGDHIGNLVFTKTGGTSLFGVDFNWGTEASALTIDGRTLTNYVFKFRMLDEMNYCGLQFKPSNMEVTVGE